MSGCSHICPFHRGRDGVAAQRKGGTSQRRRCEQMGPQTACMGRCHGPTTARRTSNTWCEKPLQPQWSRLWWGVGMGQVVWILVWCLAGSGSLHAPCCPCSVIRTTRRRAGRAGRGARRGTSLRCSGTAPATAAARARLRIDGQAGAKSDGRELSSAFWGWLRVCLHDWPACMHATHSPPMHFPSLTGVSKRARFPVVARAVRGEGW